jgi:beta-N-acetylhexosaminidase
MAGVDAGGIGAQRARMLARLDVGSVVLLGNSSSGVGAVKRVSDDIKSKLGTEDHASALVAADQEGGKVQRLAGPGFDRIPSAARQAKLSDQELTRRATRWGNQLRSAGIDADLAPVSDVVPQSVGRSNQPIGALRRGYGPDPSVVASKDAAFISGMRAAHRITAVKHFPGLGKVTGNTDTAAHVVDRQTTRAGRDLQGFRAGVRAGAGMVMLSSARYAKIDPGRPATFSTKIIAGMVRNDLGFHGVVVSDDLHGKALHATPASHRALRFFRAGGDLAIAGDPSQIASMVKTVRNAARHDHKLRVAVRKSAARVLTMKANHGLADCR